MKIIRKISTIRKLAILSFMVCLFYSCNQKPDCSNCQVTPQEEALLPDYNQGDMVVFKNDTTGAFDTLKVTVKGKSRNGCNACIDAYGLVEIVCRVSNIYIDIAVTHSPTQVHNLPGIGFLDRPFSFREKGIVSPILINNITYNDLYIISIDSTTIPANYHGEEDTFPWKIYYSKSKGFVRYYMLNGQTCSKL